VRVAQKNHHNSILRGFLLVAAALAAFGLTAAGSFHFDDYSLFSDPAITSPDGWMEVWRAARTRPLTYFTLWLNYQAGGANTPPSAY
jgi:hypothetical protein